MKLQRAAWAAIGASLVAAVGTGCETKSFIDPSEMGRYEKTPLVVPILDKLVMGVEADEVQFASAREVTDTDLQAVNTDYRVGPNDLIQVTIQDLNGQGLTQADTKRVSESGKISLPYLGQIPVAGQTEAEIEDTIVRAYAEAQILPKAVVSVVVVESQNRLYTISGFVGGPGPYPLQRADFRLLDAIAAARGVTSDTGIDYIYVIRRKNQGGQTTQPDGPATPPGPRDPLAPQSNAAPAGQTLPIFALSLQQDQPAPRTPEEARREAERLANELSAARSQNQTPANDPLAPPAPAQTPAPIPGETRDRVIQIEGAGTQPAGPTDDATVRTIPPVTGGTGTDGGMNAGGQPTMGGTGFEFTAPAEPTDREVIRVPYEPLKRGELKYNIVILPQDMIVVPSPPVGEYYLGGHVARAGVYSLTARRITLKQAIISGGMLDQLAIPARTDVIRRLGRNQEMFVRVDLERIFNGLEPDIYLKPDDQVMVGTNIGAPFAAALRNAFRITYGFGFLYDRNFSPDRQNQ